MPSKRQHTKSRRGCEQCKSRRIKCDEHPPCCGSCTKKGLDCSYRDLAGFEVPHSIQVLTQANFSPESRRSSSSRSPGKVSTPGSSVSQPDVPGQDFSSTDMLLMHHYTLYTSRTMGIVEDERLQNIWQTSVPQMAYQNSFLMHALLSITAAHQSRIDLCRQHYSRAIELFTAVVNMGTTHPCDAMYCYCVVIMLITFYLESREPDESPGPGIYLFSASMRTAVAMISTFRSKLVELEIGGLLSHLLQSPTPKIVPEAIALSLDNMDQTISADPSISVENMVALHDATFQLRRYFTLVDPRPKTWIFLLKWIGFISTDYLALVQKNDLAAMAIFSHWCVPLHHAPRKWLVGDWPRKMILRISRMVAGTVWETGVQWPISQVLGHPTDSSHGGVELQFADFNLNT